MAAAKRRAGKKEQWPQEQPQVDWQKEQRSEERWSQEHEKEQPQALEPLTFGALLIERKSRLIAGFFASPTLVSANTARLPAR